MGSPFFATHPGRPSIGLGRWAAAGPLALALVLFGFLILPALGQTQAAPAADGNSPAKIHQLVDLLSDPEVRNWIGQHARELPAKAAPAAAAAEPAEPAASEDAGGMPSAMSAGLGKLRERLVALVSTVQTLPSEFATVQNVVMRKIHDRHGGVEMLVLVVTFVAFGYAMRRLAGHAFQPAIRWLIQGAAVRTVKDRIRVVLLRFGLGLAMIVSFGLGSIGAFLLFDWPTAPRRIVLAYLFAYLCLQFAKALGLFLLSAPSPRRPHADEYRIVPFNGAAAAFWNRRLIIGAAWLAFGSVTIELMASFGLSPGATRALFDGLDFGLLVLGIDAAWRTPQCFLDEGRTLRWQRMGHSVLATLVSVYLVLLWILWEAGFTGLFAVLAVAGALPLLIDIAQRSVHHVLRPPGAEEEEGELESILGIVLERALRAVLICAAAVFVSEVSGLGLVKLAQQDTLLLQLARTLLDVVIIALIADFAWQIARVFIDVKLRVSPASEPSSSLETSRQARLLTLLPILRNALFVTIVTLAVMMALSRLGVQIGPLIASAGVVGVAVGFGAQTLVRDILSGVFYLLDDAFRVGEYIQSGNYKGVVESFSLRSVRLRHQRGPIYTVPFGSLGAVQNMSRDWTIEKMSVTVVYSTDLTKIKPLIKQIGKELLADPELAPHIIETLKLQGVENFTDYGIQLRMKMTTKPGEQFAVRRRAFVLIKQAFDANGIEFAVPIVQVGTAAEASGGAARQSLELVQAPRAAGSNAA